jgi:hypothetical protein
MKLKRYMEEREKKWKLLLKSPVRILKGNGSLNKRKT